MTPRYVLVALAALILTLSVPLGADAVTCTVTGAWNPDPTVTNSTPCGQPPILEDPANTDNSFTVGGTTFNLWDKDDGAGITDLAFVYTGTNTGFWYWDATNSLAAGNDLFALAMKDGNSGAAEPVRWAWFILQNPAGPTSGWLSNPITAGGCENSEPAGVTFTHCGTWQMYGTNGTTRKDVSHMALYGADTVPTQQTPEPTTLVLLGSGLVGFTIASRKKLRG